MSPWIDCERVTVDGPWLIITVDGDGKQILVPDHIVRGQVEVEWETEVSDGA